MRLKAEASATGLPERLSSASQITSPSVARGLRDWKNVGRQAELAADITICENSNNLTI